MFALGVALFALALAVSVALHEAGHLWVARRLGMKVRRFAVGRGPTVFSFRRGETEYGLGLFPVGGVCEIAGTTPPPSTNWPPASTTGRCIGSGRGSAWP